MVVYGYCVEPLANVPDQAASSVAVRRRDSALIFVFGLAAFTVALNPEFSGFQSRFALFARQMLRDGPDLFPRLYDVPYADYPATPIIPIYLLSRLQGRVTPLTAVLPTALVSALILVLTYRIGAKRHREWGLFAVLLSFMTYAFVGAARTITADQYTALITTACFGLCDTTAPEARPGRLWFIPVLLLIGFACRGPIGLIVPGAVVCASYLVERNWKKLLAMAAALAVTLGIGFASFWAAAQHVGGDAFAHEVARMQVFGRMEGGGVSPWYYWLGGLAAYALSYPAALWVLAARLRPILRREDADAKLLGSAACWALVVLIGLSVPGDKKMRYVLPIVPALSLIASYPLVRSAAAADLAKARRALVMVFSWLPIIGLAVCGAAWAVRHRMRLDVHAPWMATLTTLVALSIWAVRSGRTARPDNARRRLTTAGVGAVAFLTVLVGIVDPITFALERTGPFVARLQALRARDPGPIVFYRIPPDTDDVKFMVNLPDLLRPRFVQSADDLPKNAGAYCIAKRQDFDRLPSGVAQSIQERFGACIGRKDYVVFTPTTGVPHRNP